MHLGYAFLANAGEFAPDGKLYVLGADFDTLYITGLPATHPSMVLVVKLLLDVSDLGRDHDLRVSIVKPNGEPLTTPPETSIPIPETPRRPGRPSGLGIVLNMGNLLFDTLGEYVWHVEVDGQELVALPLLIEPQVQAAQDGRQE